MAAPQHLHTLDALRGVAALAVVCLHAHPLLTPIAVPHAYLAVDLFFLLSGLVIARAYAQRLDGTLSARAFMVLRVIRLYPLYLLGVAIGVAQIVLAQTVGGKPPLDGAQWVVALGSALVMLPNPLPIEDSGWLAPFNVAAWSLMFELAANAVLALCWRRLTMRVLVAIIVLSGLVFIGQTLLVGHADVGASWQTLLQGIARTAFSFFLGVAMARLPLQPWGRSRWAALLPLLLIPTFVVPREWGGGAYDLLCIVLLYPLLIALGARIEPERSGVFAFLGVTSFAIYAIHGPLLTFVEPVVKRLPEGGLFAPPWLGVGFVAVLVLVAWAADRWFDAPVRRWLLGRWRARAR